MKAKTRKQDTRAAERSLRMHRIFSLPKERQCAAQVGLMLGSRAQQLSPLPSFTGKFNSIWVACFLNFSSTSGGGVPRML